MERKCEFCKTYQEQLTERHYDHPCMSHGKPCINFERAITRDSMLHRYPRLIAHLICESLGYFTPLSAANAVAFYKAKKPFCCEWFSHMAQFEPGSTGLFDDRCVKIVQKRSIEWSFKNRHRHHGYMNEIKAARHIVAAELKSAGSTSSMLASWF